MTSTSMEPTSKDVGGEQRLSRIFPAAEDADLHPLVTEQTQKDIWNLLIVFRFINALCVTTFFQPDEYFQSLEPAWQIAFGAQSGAWITWEWHHQLRSSLHPLLFAALYYVADKAMVTLSMFPQFRAMILSVLPNIAQGILAAIGDYYTWQLAEKVYGGGSNAGWATLLMTLFSPWQWFCSTRTFSNGLETTLTIAALYYWPWNMTLDPASTKTIKQANGAAAATPVATPAKDAASLSIFQASGSLKHLRASLLLAITAIVLRPTNGLIWFCILMPTVTGFFSSVPRVPQSDYLTFLREGLICSAIVIGVSGVSDYLYFGTWTFPPYQWLTFNISLDLAVFYGRNDWHYYLSQGLPILLMTYLPFTLIGIWRSTAKTGILSLFAVTVLTTLAVLSLVSHKEVRFIYPLLPLLHILTAPSISSFFHTTTTETKHAPPFPSAPKTTQVTIIHRKLLFTLLLLTNISISYYTSRIHQSGVIAVLPFLRSEYEDLALDTRGVLISHPDSSAYEENKKTTEFDDSETFVGFLMPCHSTPWRSQLFHPGLKAWALTCEPPITLPKGSKEREEYRDEADRFYDDPVGFLKREVGGKDRPWPRYVAGFEGIESVLREYYKGLWSHGIVTERWRGRNSHWHDDERRQGDVIVWEFSDGSGEAGEA